MAEPTSTLPPPAHQRAAPRAAHASPTDPTPASSAPPPRGRRVRVVLVLALAAAVLAGGVLAGPGLLVDLAPATVRFGDGAPALAVDQFGGPEGTYVVGYEHDQSMTVAVELTSTGLVGAEVTDVRLVTQASPLLVQEGAAEAARLGSGGSARFDVPVRFDNCEAYHEREAMLVHHVDVHLQVLGRTVVERVPLDRPMMARSPMLWQCPDRSIDRSDDLRMESVR